MTWIVLPLYTRIRREETLDNFTRGQVYGYIVAHPGAHYSRIKAQLRLNNGVVAHHLQALEREGFVESRRAGLLRRFYPAGLEIPAFQDSTEERLFLAAAERPGLSQGELAAAGGVEPQVAGYYLRRMALGGVLRRRRDGKRMRYVVNQDLLLDDPDTPGLPDGPDRPAR